MSGPTNLPMVTEAELGGHLRASRPRAALVSALTMTVPPDSALPIPAAGVDAAVEWVREHLGDLTLEGPEGVAASPTFRGGQRAADAALTAYDVRGYAGARNEVWPAERRGASALSPYVRYGLLPLPRLWEHVQNGPERDREKFRDELLWQEYPVTSMRGWARAWPPSSASSSRPGRPGPSRGRRRWPAWAAASSSSSSRAGW